MDRLDFSLLFGKIQISLCDDGVWGVCYNDKYCYTSVFGFENLENVYGKTEES